MTFKSLSLPLILASLFVADLFIIYCFSQASPAQRIAQIPNRFSFISNIKLDDFQPHFKNAKLITRNQLNLTREAKLVKAEPDYYDSDEGPEEAEEEEEDVILNRASTVTPGSIDGPTTKKPLFSSMKLTTTKTISSVTTQEISTTTTTLKPEILVITTENPTTKFVDEEENSSESSNEAYNRITTTPMSLTSTISNDPTSTTAKTSTVTTKSLSAPTTTKQPETTKPDNMKIISFIDNIKLGDDFKPMFNGRVIPRTELNLTEMAKKILPEMDYYEPGEGPEDFDDDMDMADMDDLNDDHTWIDKHDPFGPKEQSMSKKVSSTTTTTTMASRSLSDTEEDDDNFEEKNLENIDLAVGGLTGIFEKIIRGPKENEVNAKSKPEDVYVYLSGIIQEESAKALKATIPRIYDFQFPIGERVSQRCFNSFAKFGDRWRNNYIWPVKMIAASSSLSVNKFALRHYGDFDSCLDIVADDDDRRSKEVFYTGQYCMVQVQLPLPLLNQSITFHDRILNFNDTELSGTFGEYFMLNAPFLYSNPLSFGMCLPSSCSPPEMESVANFFLQKLNIQVHFTSDCYSRLNMTVEALPGELADMNLEMVQQIQAFSIMDFILNLNKWQIWAIFYIFGSGSLVALATIYEIYHLYHEGRHWKSRDRNRPKSFIACFSVRYNLEQIFSVPDRYRKQVTKKESSTTTINHRNNNTSCLDAIKTIALTWICLSNFYLLGYQPQMLSSLPHLREMVLNLRTNVFYQIVIQSWLSFEVFFLISGFLFAYTSLPRVYSRDGRPWILFFIVKRLFRLLPSVIFILSAIHLLPLWSNAGPLYNSSVEKIITPCRRFYWRNLVFLSNFYNSNQVCLPYLWYISTEFQLTILGTFVLVFSYNRRQQAMKAMVALILVGIAMSGYVAYKLKLSLSTLIFENAILEEIPAVIKDLHFNAMTHFSSYFAGMALGYYARIQNNQSKLFNYPLMVRIILAFGLLFLSSSLVIYIPLAWNYLSTWRHERMLAVIYYGFSRLLFVGSSLWIISQCLPRTNVITKILSWSIFRICSHLCFQIYLLNMIFIWIYLFTKRTLMETNLMESFPVAFSLFILTCVTAMVTYLIFEAPSRSLFRYYLESPRIPSSATNNNILNGLTDFTGCETSSSTFTKELDLNHNVLLSQYNQIHSTESETSSTNCSSQGQQETMANENMQTNNNEKHCYINPIVVIE